MFFPRLDGGAAVNTATGVGTTQGSGPTLVPGITTLTSATSQTSASLPANAAAGQMLIVNVPTAATAAATVFPQTGGKIAGLAANAALSVAAGKSAIFIAQQNGLDWSAVASA